MVSGMRKVDNYLLKQKMEAKKKKEKDKTQNKQMIHTGYAILKLIKHYMQLKITNEIVISQDGEIEMNRCPYCGRCMSSFIQNIFGGWRTVWTCVCGYSTETHEIKVDNKTTYNCGQTTQGVRWGYDIRKS